jgi:ubiquinone/menaquinone biosynthesis C-methylase UbiE
MALNHEHERRFQGDPGRLRNLERLQLLEVGRVVGLCLEGVTVGRLLDVGTGTGVFAQAFAEAGIEVSGVDASAEMVELAKRYVPAGHFRTAPAEALPYPDRWFDLVFLGHVLHESDDPQRAMSEAHRTARHRVAVLEWPYRSEEHGPPLEHRLKPETISELAAQAGFAKADSPALEHMVLYRLDR